MLTPLKLPGNVSHEFVVVAVHMQLVAAVTWMGFGGLPGPAPAAPWLRLIGDTA